MMCQVPSEALHFTLLLKSSMGNKQTFAVDWWSFGIIIYEVLYGEPPFMSTNNRGIMTKIIKNQIDYPDYFSENAKDLISKLLKSNPKLRLGSGKGDAEEIKAHPFFENIKWPDVEAKKLKPLFVPEVKSDDDTDNFDRLFTANSKFRDPSHSQIFASNHNVTESNFYFNANGKHF